MGFIEWVSMGHKVNEFVEVPPVGDEGPTYVSNIFRTPVNRLRTPDGRDILIAIGPELHDLVLPAVESVALDLARSHEALLKRELESLRERLAETERRLACVYADLAEVQQRLRNFSQANVFQRIWRAIRRAV